MTTWTATQRAALSRMIAPRSKADEIAADLVHERGLSPEEKNRRIQNVVYAAWQTLITREDWARVVQPEPPAADFPEIGSG